MVTITGIKYLLYRLLPIKEETTTEPAFFIKNHYKHRLSARYFPDVDMRKSKVSWQPDVYPVIEYLGKKFECNHIMDIGCGLATKLVSMHPQFEIIGIDFGENLRRCRNEYEFGMWIESDLEKPESIKIPEKILKKTAIVCSDVIEHLVNPSFLLENLKNLMDYSPVCVISTPERDLVRGKNHFGPPTNPHHIREWNLGELEKLLRYFKFNLAFCGLTASNDKHFEKKTSIVGLKNNNSSNNSNKWNGLERQHTKILKQFF